MRVGMNALIILPDLKDAGAAETVLA